MCCFATYNGFGYMTKGTNCSQGSEILDIEEGAAFSPLWLTMDKACLHGPVRFKR